ncbi:ABC transporter ATP-binding protein [Pseudophaeobacter sp.]|uniref:ABC transporter ATP-binding protein n=1 Tax=Pseudophaeobacter sp. TaxID=1971739 RepID=UPI004059946F
MPLTLKAHSISVGYGNRTVLRALSLDIKSPGVTVIIGPNGCGKSTLLATLAGHQRPRSGSVSLNGVALQDWRSRDLALKRAFLPQHPAAPEGILVRDLVKHGRFSHRGLLSRPSKEDHIAVERALARSDTAAFANRSFDSLSGGEKQRVWIALALAQAPELLMLDEPTSFLDLGFQYQTLELLKSLARDDGLGLVMVLHDINQACLYADRLIAMDQGAILADGPPHEVVTTELVQRLFGLEVTLNQHGASSCPYIVPRLHQELTT